MKKLLFLLPALLIKYICFGHQSADSTKAIAVLQKMQYAIQQIKTLSYVSAYRQVNSEIDDSIFTIDGKIWLEANTTDSIFGSRLHISSSYKDGALDYYYDGQKVYEIRPKDKTTTIVYPANFANNIHNPGKARIAFVPFVSLLTDTAAAGNLLMEKPAFSLEETPSAWVVILHYPANTYGAIIHKRLTINKATYLPIEVKQWGEFNGTHFSSEYAVSNMRVNDVAIADSIGLLQPPQAYAVEEIKKPSRNIDTTAYFFTGKKAPLFKYASLDGQQISLTALNGKYVLLDFWESWCGYCIIAIPKIEALYNSYRAKGLQVLGVTTENITQIKKIVQRNTLSYPTLVGDEKILSQYRVIGRPTYVLIAPDGNIAVYSAGDLDVVEKYLQKVQL